MAKTSPPNPPTPIAAGVRRCPICGKPSAPRYQPFCSARCVDIDLGRWLKGNYRVETEERPQDAPEGDEC